MEDRELVAGCLRRDPEAWSALVARYGGLIYSRVRDHLQRCGVSADSTEIQDVFQEVFTRLLEHDGHILRQWRGQCSLGAWICFVARTECRKWLVRARRLPDVNVDSLEIVLAAPPAGTDEEEQCRKQQLSKGLRELSPADRTILRLYFQEGLKYKEIARVLNVSINSIGPALSRALERLSEKARSDARKDDPPTL